MKGINLYSQRRLTLDKLFFGSFYIYKIGIFYFRLSPTKVIVGTDGMCFTSKCKKIKLKRKNERRN